MERENHCYQIVIHALYLYLASIEQGIEDTKDIDKKSWYMVLRTDTKRLIQGYEKKLKELEDKEWKEIR